ncbi:MAG: LPXTG cell wall anchor domain-containing protein [Bacteroidia bacterium]|nr:LPXTG cell wall anchor domain-containing protein [Bacteroidia bacterium]
MKKSILMFTMTGVLFLGSLGLALAQPATKKDSVNADKAAKPVFYNAAAEEEKPKSEGGSNIALIGGAVVVLGAAIYFLTKKKK